MFNPPAGHGSYKGPQLGVQGTAHRALGNPTTPVQFARNQLLRQLQQHPQLVQGGSNAIMGASPEQLLQRYHTMSNQLYQFNHPGLYKPGVNDSSGIPADAAPDDASGHGDGANPLMSLIAYLMQG